MLNTICPDICVISETFERERNRIRNILQNGIYKSISYYRKNRAPGGGCAILYNETRFSVVDLEITSVQEEVENVWAMISPKQAGLSSVKRVAIGSYYVSPKSRYKKETIEHIINTIHTLRARYDNEVNFIIAGDFNRLDPTDILDSYGALHQVITVPTRKAAALEIIMTDLHTHYHAPTTIPPLQVDEGKLGQDSDHSIVVFAPKHNVEFKKCTKKKMIKTRPLPESNIQKYENELAKQPWEEMFEGKTVNQMVELFHNFLIDNLEKYFPEKCTMLSNFDKKWMSPELKQIHRSMQREFFKHRKSLKYKQLKSKYKKLKKKSIRSFYTNFVSELKSTDPGRWFSMAKKIGAVKEPNGGEIQVESLSNLTNKECAEKIAQHFSAVSNEYQPINYSLLPCYLPAPPPPQVEEYDVYNRINRIKKRKSTLPIDIPEKLRNECAVFLAAPLTIIINSSLKESVFPALWKSEWVTPAPKISNPQNISDLRKISCTSDYSKLFEGYLKEWIREDISDNIDSGQFGGQAGMGTEHMLVCYIDRILKLLDTHPHKSAVIATSLDWASAFDRQDPTLAIMKFIRPSLIPLLANYLTDRR